MTLPWPACGALQPADGDASWAAFGAAAPSPPPQPGTTALHLYTLAPLGLCSLDTLLSQLQLRFPAVSVRLAIHLVIKVRRWAHGVWMPRDACAAV